MHEKQAILQTYNKKSHRKCHVYNKLGVGNLFTIMGSINGGLSLAGRKNNWFNPKIQPSSNYEG